MTVAEEVGLEGANALDGSLLTGGTLINLDSEEDGVLTVGCAGSTDTWIRVDAPRDGVLARTRSRCSVAAGGGLGGHSGVQIALGRANAIKVLGRVLREAYEAAPFRLVSLDGGKSRNAIPRDAVAVCSVAGDREEAFRAAIESATAVVRDAYAKTDPGATVTVESAADAGGRLDGEATRTLLDVVALVPTGPLAMSPDFDGLVETSTSLGEATTEGGTLTLHSLSRSSNDSAMPEVIARARRRRPPRRRRPRGEVQLQRLAARPRLARCCRLRVRVYERLFGEPPVVSAIHAGLETSVIGTQGRAAVSTCSRSARRSRGRTRPTSVSAFPRCSASGSSSSPSSTSCRSRRASVMRGPLAWILAIVGGIVVVLIVTAAIGNRDKSGDTVSAASYAQTRVRRRRDVARRDGGDRRRDPPGSVARRARSRGAAVGDAAGSRRASSAPGSRAASGRPKTLVEGIDNAGVPDTPQGEDAAKSVSDWADAAVDDLEQAQDSLEEEADTLEEAVEPAHARDAGDRGGARRRRQDDRRRRARRSGARRRVPRLEHVPTATGGAELDMSTSDWLLVAIEGPGRHRLHRARRALRRYRPRALGRRRHARPRLLLRARPGRAADQRDADHHRRHLRGGGDAGRGRHRLHGPDREQGATRETEGTQLRRAVRLLPAHDPDRDEQHVLLDHPGDQRGRLREQDPARARRSRARPSPRRSGSPRAPWPRRRRRCCRWSRSTTTTSSTSC